MCLQKELTFPFTCALKSSPQEGLDLVSNFSKCQRVCSVCEWKTLLCGHGPFPLAPPPPYLQVALALPDVVLQQEVVLQGEAAVLIVQLRQEVVKTDGGERNVIGGVLPRWNIHTLSRGCPKQTRSSLPPCEAANSGEGCLSFYRFPVTGTLLQRQSAQYFCYTRPA